VVKSEVSSQKQVIQNQSDDIEIIELSNTEPQVDNIINNLLSDNSLSVSNKKVRPFDPCPCGS
jgi:hypothetical protein